MNHAIKKNRERKYKMALAELLLNIMPLKISPEVTVT